MGKLYSSFPIAEMSLDKIANDPNLISNHIKNLRKPNGDITHTQQYLKLLKSLGAI